MKVVLSALSLSLLIAAGVSPASAQTYPLRAKYPREKFVSTAELATSLGQALIVDVRDQSEYDVLHIEGAKLLPVEALKVEQLQALRAGDASRPIVFYCNGITCEKSYKAAAKAAFWEVPNTMVYDAGIFDWAKAHPQQSRFFGQLLNAETIGAALISHADFDAVCLAPADFKARAADPGFKIYDVRERADREARPVGFNNDTRMGMDAFVAALGQGSLPKEKLLIYDNVGKQVIWLQYYLTKYGVKKYYFLKGGVLALKAD